MIRFLLLLAAALLVLDPSWGHWEILGENRDYFVASVIAILLQPLIVEQLD